MRVPDRAQTSPTVLTTRRREIGAPACVRRVGVSRTSSSRSATNTSPRAAGAAKVGVHPASRSNSVIGTVAAIAPIWPNWPVSWVTRGMRTTGNHELTRRNTLVKITASPPPMNTRAMIAAG